MQILNFPRLRANPLPGAIQNIHWTHRFSVRSLSQYTPLGTSACSSRVGNDDEGDDKGHHGGDDLGHDGTDGNDEHDDEDLLGEDGDVSHE